MLLLQFLMNFWLQSRLIILLMFNQMIKWSSFCHLTRCFIDLRFEIIVAMLFLKQFLHHFFFLLFFVEPSFNFIPHVFFTSFLDLLYNYFRGQVDLRLKCVLMLFIFSLSLSSFSLSKQKYILPFHEILSHIWKICADAAGIWNETRLECMLSRFLLHHFFIVFVSLFYSAVCIIC